MKLSSAKWLWFCSFSISDFQTYFDDFYLKPWVQSIICEIALWWITLPGDKSTLIEAVTWCHQATSYPLNWCWPRSMIRCHMISPEVCQLNSAIGFLWIESQAVLCMLTIPSALHNSIVIGGTCLMRPGICPTNRILIEFEIRFKFGVLWFKMC